VLRIALIVYIAVVSLLVVGSLIGKIALKLLGKYDVTPRNVQIEEAITLPLLMPTLLGFYGYLQDVAIFNAVFWQYYLALIIIHLLVSFFLPKNQWVAKELGTRKMVQFNAVGVLLSLPTYYILYLYGFANFPSLASL